MPKFQEDKWHFILKFQTKNYKNYVNESFASRIHDLYININ